MVSEKLDALAALARQHGVARLFLFGSGVTSSFDELRSDLDFLVEFQPGTPAQHAQNYFGLMEGLEGLFGRPIDLVEPGPIRNPYFRQEIERTKRTLYEAA